VLFNAYHNSSDDEPYPGLTEKQLDEEQDYTASDKAFARKLYFIYSEA